MNEIYRRDSDQYSEISCNKMQSNLERNCNQFFVRGPALTKDFFEKVQTDVVPSKTEILGYRMKTSRFLILCGFFLLFATSFFTTIIMWTTPVFENYIASNKVISEESPFYDMWRKPTVKPIVKIYLFNYTNVERYTEKLDEKLNVVEVGPYTYEETIEKVNIRFIENGNLVTYQEKRIYRFIPELSNGTDSDTVIVPNMILIAGAATVKHMMFLIRMSFSGLLNSLSQKPFMNINVSNFVIGYNDDLFHLSKSFLKFRNQRVLETFGLLSWRAGIQQEEFTMDTGRRDVDRAGILERYDGKSSMGFWETDSCNNLQVSDGVTFPANLVSNKQMVKYYVPQLCRVWPLIYKEEVMTFDGQIPAYRYAMPDNIFDLPEDNPESQCFCSDGVCAPKGLFNVTQCTFGAPIFYSAPHFYQADEKIQTGVNGIKPGSRPYGTEVYLHPTMGFIMGGKSYIQVNIQVQKSFGMSNVNMFEDGLILPVSWFEAGAEDKDIPQDVRDIIYQATYTLPFIEIMLKYGSFLTATVTFLCIFLVLRNEWLSRKKVVPTENISE